MVQVRLGCRGIHLVASAEHPDGLFLWDFFQDEAGVLGGGLVEVEHTGCIDHQ
jgi:hypothetical protein